MADTAGYNISSNKHFQNTRAHTRSATPRESPRPSPAHMSNKRKRDARDQGQATSRAAPAVATTNPTNTDLSDQATASFLAAHNATSAEEDMQQQFEVHQNNGANAASVGDTAAAALAYHQMTVPQATELSFQPSSGGDSSFNIGDPPHSQQGMQDFSLEALKAATSTPRAGPTTNDSPPNTGGQKPQVGSDEWHKVRRDNHKEVERRRRETINEGINELAKIVPGCEKNKGSILQRAVQFITQLKENEQQNIEKWTLEKLLTEQAITELSASCDKFKADAQRAYDELEIYKRACDEAGITPDEIKQRDNNVDQNGQI